VVARWWPPEGNHKGRPCLPELMTRSPFRKLRESLRNILPDYLAVNLMYYGTFRKLPNLKHPRTFNEKVAWRKLYQRNPQFRVFCDKIAVKAEIARLIGRQYVIETLWTGDNPEDIPFDELVPPYVIKVSHGSGGNVFVRTVQDIKRERIVASMREQLAFRHGRRLREWGYLGIPPMVLIEPMVEMPNDDLPDEYKFFVYHGRAHFIQFACDRARGLKLNFYDREWNLLPAKLKYPQTSKPVSRPETLGKLIELAERIGAQFDFVRVDLYSPPQGILFSEVTFYPNAGLEAFTPQEWDSKFGEPWQICC